MKAVQLHIQTRTVAPELVDQPPLRCSDSVLRVVLRREYVASSKALQFLERPCDAFFRDLVHNFPDHRIHPGDRRLRKYGRAREQRHAQEQEPDLSHTFTIRNSRLVGSSCSASTAYPRH